MGIREIAWNTIKWKFIKKRLGYDLPPINVSPLEREYSV